MASRSRQHLQCNRACRCVSTALARGASQRTRQQLARLAPTRQRALLTALIERIDVGTNRIDIHIRPTGLGALLDPAAALSPNATDGETQTLSVLVKLRRCGREMRMLVGTDPFATAKPDRRLIKFGPALREDPGGCESADHPKNSPYDRGWSAFEIPVWFRLGRLRAVRSFSPLRTDSLPFVSKIYWPENADDAIMDAP